MKPGPALRICLLAAGLGLIAGTGATNSAPNFSNEHLRYSVNWPSGLSLGEGQLSATRSKPAGDAPARLDLSFSLDAAVPGFQVSDRYHSVATSALCSLEFDKKIAHGAKKADERIIFDPDKQTASRETSGGGKSELKTGACGKDALAFLYFVRNELSQGRLPPGQPVYFGGAYQVRVEFTGTQSIPLGEKPAEADRLAVSIKGQSSDINVEVFFLKDAARTPALVRVPLALGSFSMELVREP